MKEIAKSQWVRIWDVAGMTPWMIYLAHKYKMKGWQRGFMVWAQVGTLLFNLRNLIRDRNVPTQRYHKIPFRMSSIYNYESGAEIREARAVQALRMGDIFLYGPMCMIIAKQHEMEPIEEAFLWYTGISTILLNGANYILNRKEMTDAGI